MANIVQTFFVDPAAVGQADTVSFTSVDLYFKAKPNRTTNETGIDSPGITVGICEFNQDTTTLVMLGQVRMTYDEVYPASDASVITKFSFVKPITVATNKSYGIAVIPEDGGYQPWVNKTGDRIVGTNDPSGGVTSNRAGRFFSFTGTTISNEQPGTSLKMSVSIAKYTESSIDVDLVNDSYEFLTVDTRVNTFVGGEWVFANTALATGNVAVTTNTAAVVGSGTAFDTLVVGQAVVLSSGVLNHVGWVSSVTNSTAMTINPPAPWSNTIARYRQGIVGRVVLDDVVADKLSLRDSNANTTAKFVAGHLLTGSQSQATANVASIDNLTADKFVAHIQATATSVGSMASKYTIAYSNGSAYTVANTFATLPNGTPVPLGTTPRYVLSRSNEVAEPTLWTNNRSAIARITVTSSSAYAAPIVNYRESDFVVYQNQVSNTYLRPYGNGAFYDGEVGLTGVAKVKHITKKMTFDNSTRAEDIVVYMSAFKPAGTDVRLYARIYNASDEQPFDDKLWSPLVLTSANVQSSVDKHDFLEYQYMLPQFPASLKTANGRYTTVSNSAIITAVGATPSAEFTAGQVVKVYNETFPENYIVSPVVSANSTTVTLRTPINYAGVTGAGQKIDIVEFGQTAYRNKSNFGVVRYFNSNGGVFDGYNTIQVKAVLLADTTTIVPEIDQLEVIGVSA